ncbi:MAG TPA: NADH-quinone oxidoreductase subunit C [Casimicrobiaceae bacterium]|nr:NADH-quinone oxidoreductase subunit C [Casimicrobiaceae bacterium]
MGAEALAMVRERLASAATDIGLDHGMLVVSLPREALLPAVTMLKDELAFDLFLDVTAVDWPERDYRFEVVYHFYSTRHFVRVRVKTHVLEQDASVDSLVGLYGAAGYMERECHEMYGIDFRGNPDLRHILLYEGFVGHPLRKDYDKEHEQPLVPYRQ